ncbi:hypothetical protein acsn021_09780 [Anaerocolumna cellulosilytica]|uniref:Uncharacterized protein n=1 Tax=Anaerocolumna cellulosilytica TaxID=433286 RepID=A0A6S6QWH1_9FIRM|nr:methyl-accepting chemotaxis protein [Anaerocolumna cellulosilytica]MBB5194464.1 methyl-accepting chemotaxis protein [Anaerocolumna cellulosilytica]BCJ93409.1 hypothetical protein acsn021_09780 [Anaerocolumna cellulosilytica]
MKKRLDFLQVLLLIVTNTLIYYSVSRMTNRGTLNETKAFLAFILLSSITVCLINFFGNQKIVKFMQEIRYILSQFNEGNFTVGFHGTSNRGEFQLVQEEFEALRCMFNNWVHELLNSAVSIKMSADIINSASGRTADGMGHLNYSLNEIKQFFEESSGMLNDIAGTTIQLADSSMNITTLSSAAVKSIQKTNRNAVKGSEAMERVTSSMQQMKENITASYERMIELEQTSKQIGTITDTIASISQQTNLLALNAAIESARAGEHGKGFAVVADEVRKLAEESKTATDEINELIQMVWQEIADAVAAMKQVRLDADLSVELAASTGDNFKNMMNTLTDTVTLIEKISIDVNEQSNATDTISQSTATAAEKGHIGTASVQEIASVLETQLEDAKLNQKSTNELLKVSLNLDEIMKKYDYVIGNQMLSVCHQIASLHAKKPLTYEDLMDIQFKSGLTEIHLFDENGVVFLSNNKDIIGFQCSTEAGSQTYEFSQLLHTSSIEVNQKTAFRDIDGKLFKYAGIAMADGKGIIQCGLEASTMIHFKGSL